MIDLDLDALATYISDCMETTDDPLFADCLALITRVRSLRAALDEVVWGFAGEPRRCARCNCNENTEHSDTCPMPDFLWRVLAAIDPPEGGAG